MTRRTPAAVVCARGPGGLNQADLDALTESVRRYLETRCQAPSALPVPARSRRDEPRTYTCGLPAGHPPEVGHRWPVEGPLIVAWCDWPRP